MEAAASDTPAALHEEARRRYLNYALSVITSRALPDVRDGLKPVQRRIVYGMYADFRLTPDAKYQKCAEVCGQIMGRYHPHGDQAIYDALVRMAQDFSLRYPLVDGHGNFGSLDGDAAAAIPVHRVPADADRDGPASARSPARPFPSGPTTPGRGPSPWSCRRSLRSC